MIKKYSINALHFRARSRRITAEDVEDWLSHADTVTGSHYWMDDGIFAELCGKYEPEEPTRQPCSGCGKNKSNSTTSPAMSNQPPFKRIKTWYPNFSSEFLETCEQTEKELATSILTNHTLKDCGRRLRIGRLILNWAIRTKRCPKSGEGGPFEEGEEREQILRRVRALLEDGNDSPHKEHLQALMSSVLKGEKGYDPSNNKLRIMCDKVERHQNRAGK